MSQIRKIKQLLLSVFLVFIISLSLTGCASNVLSGNVGTRTLTDPSGKEIVVPEKINSIGILGPSLVETVINLGEGNRIQVIDTNSKNLEGINNEVTELDLTSPDIEKLKEIHPDLLLVADITYSKQPKAFQPLKEAGITIVTVPTAESIDEIEKQINFLGTLFNKEEKGQQIVNEMQSEINKIKAVGESIPDKKKVYFEIDSSPNLFSFGSNVYLNEMIEIIGAKNIFDYQVGWIPVTEESVLTSNPDVILTNLNNNTDTISNIKNRKGWNNIKAVTGNLEFIFNSELTV